MTHEEFCDVFCPIPHRWVEFPKVDTQVTVDCDLEESECPFKDVDFSKVHAYNKVDGYKEPEPDHELINLLKGAGYGVTIGADATLAKIKEMGGQK